ncbi:glycosyltransferase [Pseudoalteromonas sp. T1lg65]|uniref:glycosyltransferase n=1 Tax=Pseudoalteromonas sp. T1lg65 TaxID=2077101 RepID=UPI003F7AAE67
MNLLAIIENISDEYGGPANSLPNLLYFLFKNESIKSQIVTVCATNKESNVLIDKYSLSWRKCERVGLKKVQYAKELKIELSKIISKDTVLFSNNLWNYPAYISYRLSKKKNIPHVISVRGSLYPWSLKQSKVLKKVAWVLFQRKALTDASLIHVTCKDELEAVRDLGINTPVALCPHGIDYAAYQTLPSRVESLEKMGLDPNKKYILFMSRLHKKKGLDFLLNVWPALSKKYSDWCLLIVGPDYDGYKQKIEDLRRESSLHKNLMQLGMLKGEAKEQVLALSSFFILPSYSENFGVVIGEALAAGLPVVTTKGVPWSEIESFSCGKQIELTEENLMFSMEEMMLLSDRELKEMGRRGKKLILNNYSWEAQASKFAKALDFISNGKPVPDIIFQ